MNTSKKIKQIAGLGILLALTIIFGIIGNYIQVGPVSFNLSLLPISIGAILYGPLAGLFIGIVNGIIVLLSPSTGFFLSYNLLGTILIVLVKTGLAGLASGFLFKLLKKSNFVVAIILSCIIVPIINTLIFGLGCFTLFSGFVFDGVENAFVYFCLVLVGWNFIFEISASAILSPTVVTVVKTIGKKYDIGVNLN